MGAVREQKAPVNLPQSPTKNYKKFPLTVALEAAAGTVMAVWSLIVSKANILCFPDSSLWRQKAELSEINVFLSSHSGASLGPDETRSIFLGQEPGIPSDQSSETLLGS